MRCSRCGFDVAALDRNARVCPNCGLPLPSPDAPAPRLTAPPVAGGAPGDWGQATAPAPAYRPSSPPGQSPAPTSPPDPQSFATQRLPTVAANAPRDDPSATLDASPTITIPALAGNGGGWRSRRRLLSIVAVVVVAAVTLGVIGALAANGGSKKTTGARGATATATAHATPTLPANYTLYTDTSRLYAVAYPSDWSTTPVDGTEFSIIEFSQSNLGATLEIERVSLLGSDLTAASAQPLFTQVFEGFAHAVSSSGNVGGDQSAISQVKLAGSTWFEERGDINYTVAGSPMSSRIVVDITNHGGSTLMVARIAAQASDYDSLNTQYFTPMLATFRFLT